MQRNRGARLFPLFIILVVVALLIAAVVSIGRALFAPGDQATETSDQVDVGRESLLSTDLGRSVSMTVRGPIVAEEEASSYRITVGPDERRMNVYKGYLETRTKSEVLDNNVPAYEQLVFALDKAKMMEGSEPEEDDENDIRGLCATGYLYEFAVQNDGEDLKRLWTSSCEGSPGSLEASKDQLTGLFLRQIPESGDLIPFSRRPQLRL